MKIYPKIKTSNYSNEENHGKTELITAKLQGVPKKVIFRFSLDFLLRQQEGEMSRQSREILEVIFLRLPVTVVA